MPFLTTSEFNLKLTEEISKVTEELHIVSAFCKIDAVKFIDNNIKHVLKSKKLLVRFLPNDIIQGATDFDLYDYCKVNGWQLYIRFDLHAKTYIFDKQRYIIGSGNLTLKGLGLNCLGNYELGGFSQIEGEDLKKIDALFSSAILVTDELYLLMKQDIERFKDEGKHINNSINWNKLITDKFSPELNVLFTYDFPTEKVPTTNVEVYEFLELSGNVSMDQLKQKFRWSKAFLWLYTIVNAKPNKEIYFGELTAILHNALINDPKPYRKEVKDLLANLLGWVDFFNYDLIKIDRPNYSQRIKITR